MLDFGYYNMDCMEGMKEFPNKYFDLAIVDPPYGININMNIGLKKGKKKKREQKEWDKTTPDDKYFKELFRISKNQVIWGAIISILDLVIVFLYGIRAKACIIEVFQNVSLRGLLLMKAHEYSKRFLISQTVYTLHKNPWLCMNGF